MAASAHSSFIDNINGLWHNRQRRAPLLFSLALHLGLFLCLLIPSDFFHWQHRLPDVYTVDLIEIEPPAEQPQEVEEKPPPPPPIAKPKEETTSLSTTPLLSSRVMPAPPEQIRILRPRASKKVMRHKRDSTPVLDAYARIRAKEKMEQELAEAQARAEQEKQKALELMAQAILARKAPTRATTQAGTTTTTDPSPDTSTPSGAGISSSNALRIYKAAVSQQIASQWVLPEGQQWPPSLKAVVVVKINRDGIILSQKFATRSGNGQFDKFVRQAMEKASPLPRLPAELAEDNYALRLTFFPRGLQ